MKENKSPLQKKETTVPNLNTNALLALLLILILAFTIRAHPAMMGSLVGPDPHFHLRMTNTILETHTLPVYDNLSMQGRFFSYAPLFHTTFATFSLLSNLDSRLIINILPAIYGTAGVLLVFFFSRRIFKNNKIALFSALTLAVMNLHIMRTASYARTDGLGLLIVPAIIYLFYLKRTRIATLLSVAMVLLHPLSTTYLLFFLIAWAIYSKFKKIPFPNQAALTLILLTTTVFLLWLISLPYPLTDYISGTSFESSELGKPEIIFLFSLFTFSWAFILLAIYKIKNNLFLKFWLLFSFIFLVFGVRLGIFLSIPAAIISGFGINFAWEKLRNYRAIFALLLALLICLAVMPRLYLNNYNTPPAEREAMQWIKENTEETSSLAARWDRGHPLTYYSERKVVIDGYFEFAPGLEERNEAMKTLISTSNCEKIQKNSEAFHADYFYANKRSINSPTYKHGILEAKDCVNLESIFASDNARVLKFI